MNRTAIILLSTYQGEKYISAQLDSILLQSYSEWMLLIRDDGSSDKTVEIIKKYIQRDNRMRMIEDDFGNIRPARSYCELMKTASVGSESYIFFSDQDDVWLPEKLALEIKLLDELSQQYGNNMPLLVHTDLCVVNANLNIIHSSYLNYERLSVDLKNPLTALLVSNYVTGCTIGMNRALLQFCCSIPDNVIMHDWWCALCAALVGKIGFINQSTVLYRQHDANVIGSKGYYNKFTQLFTRAGKSRKNNFYRKFSHASHLMKRINPDHPDVDVIETYGNLPNLTRLRRVMRAIQLPLQFNSWLSKVMFLFYLATL